jgi:hypothetical protein
LAVLRFSPTGKWFGPSALVIAGRARFLQNFKTLLSAV